jgi:lipid-binding SYLF domain-containing protein
MKPSFHNAILIAAIVASLAPTRVSRAADDDKKLEADAKQAVANFKLADPGLTNFFSKAIGYAILPTVAEGGFIVAAEHGKGLVYEKGKLIGKSSLTEVSVGAQVGGGVFSEIVFFETAAALDNFKQGKCEMSAGAKATVAASGAAVNAKYQQGVAVFTLPKSGAMVAAAIGGQKFKFQPIK